MANYLIIDDTKWEYLITDDTIKLKTELIKNTAAIEGVFQYLSEKYGTDGNPCIQSCGWELRQISYGKRGEEKKEYLEDVYEALVNNSFVNGASHYKFYSTSYLRKPAYDSDFESFILKAVK